MKFSFITNNENETIKLGELLSQSLRPGDIIGFFGNLGSGKTHIIKGICSGLNCANQVSSPTFTLINEYRGKYPVYHFDFYRIDSEIEIYDLGYEEYFYGSGICLVEWAERVASFLPTEYIGVYLKGIFEKGKENIREITIGLHGKMVDERSWDVFHNKPEPIR
ncbi:tRNA (adenosine(37)-N6)-threonylcarbamoyltransferase complex ATPase subunit type 1 TsaE [candidate division KSB1 bacterium]|nr:tRNA (adenosine(37)-N6)-threonylcarbamoyltransferase complex ATPase subunit type 1 TsaE [candidate division KSB1 bacterium]MBL7095404.1 tRNA (adenosine(37)-N6)-threonylcarbamoyltransferase complex ATPase subunit type 1 TsaE [candidate division KSB1 bacterium]